MIETVSVYWDANGWYLCATYSDGEQSVAEIDTDADADANRQEVLAGIAGTWPSVERACERLRWSRHVEEGRAGWRGV